MRCHKLGHFVAAAISNVFREQNTKHKHTECKSWILFIFSSKKKKTEFVSFLFFAVIFSFLLFFFLLLFLIDAELRGKHFHIRTQSGFFEPFKIYLFIYFHCKANTVGRQMRSKHLHTKARQSNRFNRNALNKHWAIDSNGLGQILTNCLCAAHSSTKSKSFSLCVYFDYSCSLANVYMLYESSALCSRSLLFGYFFHFFFFTQPQSFRCPC